MIHCKALQENSLYLTSGGHIIPCGFIYTNGPYAIPKELVEFSKEENFESLVATWDSEKPYIRCYQQCDDRNTDSTVHMIHFDKQHIKGEKSEDFSYRWQPRFR